MLYRSPGHRPRNVLILLFPHLEKSYFIELFLFRVLTVLNAGRKYLGNSNLQSKVWPCSRISSFFPNLLILSSNFYFEEDFLSFFLGMASFSEICHPIVIVHVFSVGCFLFPLFGLLSKTLNRASCPEVRFPFSSDVLFFNAPSSSLMFLHCRSLMFLGIRSL